MAPTKDQIQAVARVLAAGGYILSDNDGTLAPFTASPDETIIPQPTVQAIDDFRAAAGQGRFILTTGRPLNGMLGVLARSGAHAESFSILADDGATWMQGGTVESNIESDERAFIEHTQSEVAALAQRLASEQPALQGKIILEFKSNGLMVNTNAVFSSLGEETDSAVQKAFHDAVGRLCADAPIHNGHPAYALHQPPGHGIELRSVKTTKRQGVERLLDRGVIPADKPLILFVDDLKPGGNDVALATLVRERGGIVVQVKNQNSGATAIAPDVVIDDPALVGDFMQKVLKEYRGLSLRPGEAPQPII